MSFVADHRQDPATLQRGLDASKALFTYLEPHIAARRAEPGGDLLSVLCTSEIEGRLLTDPEVQGTCSLLLAAGADTAEKALALFLTNLVDHADVQTAVADDPDLLDAAWAESLRRDPPTHVIVRQAAEAIELPSGTVPAGATVACLLASANRDPEHPRGSTTATDIDMGYLTGDLPDNLNVLRHDVTREGFAPSSFDLIHARALFVHLPARQRLLSTAARWLKPGGWLLVEDPDVFPVLSSPHPLFRKVALAGAELLSSTLGTELHWPRTQPTPLLQASCGKPPSTRSAPHSSNGT